MYKFKENNVVCFFGDSITHQGKWIRRIYDYYINTVGTKLEIYNCGVAGDNALSALGRMDETLFIHNPTDVVIMFGMNDVRHDLYYDDFADDNNIINRRRCIDNSIESIRAIADRLKNENIRIIFVTPTPYDELSERDEHCYTGVAAALCEIAKRIKSLSENYGANVVDFNTQIYEKMKKMYKVSLSPIGEDRVHPTDAGHELMAQIFLRSQGFDIKVSDSLSELEKIAAIPYGKWEQKRYKLEQDSKATDYIEWCLYSNIKDKEKIRELIDRDLPKMTNPYVVNCAKIYRENILDTKKLQSDLIKHTKSIYTIK